MKDSPRSTWKTLPTDQLSLHSSLFFPPYHVSRIEIRHQIWNSARHPRHTPSAQDTQWSFRRRMWTLGPLCCGDFPRHRSRVFCSSSVPRRNVAQSCCVLWKSSQKALCRVGGTQHFYKRTGECQNHRLSSSFSKIHEAWLDNVKGINWEKLIFCLHLPSLYTPLKET